MSGRFLLRCTGLTCYTCSVTSGLGVRPMKRREFITLVSGVVVWPRMHAQSKAVRRVGVLMNGTATEATV